MFTFIFFVSAGVLFEGPTFRASYFTEHLRIIAFPNAIKVYCIDIFFPLNPGEARPLKTIILQNSTNSNTY